MKHSNKSHFLTILAILCMGVALSASRLRLPAFSQSAGAAAQAQAAVVGNDAGDSATADRSVVLQTDKMNYAPGEVIIVAGSGWDPGEAVTLRLHEEPAAHADRSVTVIADASGNIWDNQFMQDGHDRGVMLQLTATGRSSGLSTQAAFGNPSANLDQWANKPTGSWVNGNLGASKAQYFEGDSIPYRLGFGSLSLASHTVTIEWDTTKSGKHALDYLTTYNRSVSLDQPNPCDGVSPCPTPTTFAIPADPQVTGFTPIAGNFTLYGGTITAVGAYSGGTAFPTGDNSRRISITFTATQANPVLAWGGHISTRLDWGANNSCVAIPGSPYHTRLVDLDGSGGNQDRSLSADAVIFLGSVTIVKDANVNGATSFPFTASPSPLAAFSLVDDGTSANTKVFSGISNFQTYTVNETPIPSGWAFSSILCSVTSPNGGSATTSTTQVAIALHEGENWTCTYTNLQNTPTPTNTPTTRASAPIRTLSPTTRSRSPGATTGPLPSTSIARLMMGHAPS